MTAVQRSLELQAGQLPGFLAGTNVRRHLRKLIRHYMPQSRSCRIRKCRGVQESNPWHSSGGAMKIKRFWAATWVRGLRRARSLGATR